MDIAVENLSKQYHGVPVLPGFSAIFPDGKTTCIMGPSGCGKTTLLRILMGLEPADGGKVKGMSGRKISAVFQEDRLCENLSAVSNIRIVCPKTVEREAIEAALRAVGLEEASLYQPAAELSGGMKRRVAIVRGVLAPSEVVLMDEPFRGLDEGTRARTAAFVKENLRGKTLILVTHDPEEPDMMGGGLIVMG